MSGTILIANLTINLLHGNNKIVETMLNIVCTLAICLATLPGSSDTTNLTTIPFNKIKNMIVPNILNIKCIIAALLAFLFAAILDINDVTQVPIFCPYNIGNADESGTNPWDAKTTSIPIAADELWIIAVIPYL